MRQRADYLKVGDWKKVKKINKEFRGAIYDALNAITKAFNCLYSDLCQVDDETALKTVNKLTEETKSVFNAYIEQQKNTLFVKRNTGNMPNAIDCMVQHLKQFHIQACNGKKSDFGEPCISCIHVETCNLDWLSIMQPLLAQTSIKFCIAAHEEHADKQDKVD